MGPGQAVTSCGQEEKLSFIYSSLNVEVVSGGTKRNQAPSSEADRSDTGDQDLSPGLGWGREAGLCRLHFAVLAHGSVDWCLGVRYPGLLPVGSFRRWGLVTESLEEAALGLQLRLLCLRLLKLLATQPGPALLKGRRQCGSSALPCLPGLGFTPA